MRRVLLFLAFSVAALARTTLNFDLQWLFVLGDEGNAPPAPVCNATRWPLNLTNFQCYGLSRAGSFQTADACCAAGLAANANVWQFCPLTGCGGGANMPGDCWTGGLAGLTDCGHSEPGWISFALNETLPPPGPRPPPPPPVCPGDRACKDYDDSSWRQLNIPHDFIVEGTPVSTADRNHGYLPFNISWYRKHFTIDPSWQGNPIWLDFDGVYRSSDFYLNGEWLGHWESGYAPFRFYLHNGTASGLVYGGDNVLSVRVDALSFQEGWFYEGGGIYRSCTLNTAPTTNLVPWGIYIPSVLTGAISSPQGLSGPQTAASAYVPLFIDVQNSKASGTTSDAFTLTATLVDAEGGVVGSTNGGGTLLPGGWARITPPPMNPTNVSLWSPSSPYLYTMVVTLTGPGGSLDSVNTTIGLRSAIFDANAGLLLNGLPLQIQGFSQHQDFGGLGTAAVPRVAQARVAAVKAIGCNGWRTAHNPVASEILDATDRMGVLVWSENRNLERQVIGTPRRMTEAQGGRGGSSRGVTAGGAQAQALAQHPALRAPIDPSLFPDPQYLMEAAQMVLRDRNHPSIIIWSLCNEGGCMQGNPLGGIVASAFKNTILNIDTMRPITANSEDYPGDTLTRITDVEAFSYNYGEYDGAHRRYPWKPVIGGESASCVSDRGYYGPENATTGHINADDIGCVVSAWQSVGTRPWVIGNFAWTGMDYKGEPSPLNWPDINSHFGVLDIAAFEKDSTGYYKSWWLNDTTRVYILPNSWNFPPGPLPMPITVFAVAPYAELFVNGVSQGIKSIPPYGVATWGAGIEWVAGNISAVSYSLSNATLATTTIHTTGPPSALRLTADFDSSTIAANAQDVSLLRLEVVDAGGAMVPDASPLCTWSVDGVGVGDIVGLANGDPSDLTPDKVGNPSLPYGGVWARKAYHGLARGIVQSTGSTPGTVTVTVKSPGLTDATFTVTTV